MGPEGLGTVLILFAAVVAALTGMRRLQLPPILGYLVVGVLVGPQALALVHDGGTTSFLAELGVVFLLFTLGLEFSLPRMIAMRGEVLGLGSLQVFLTTLVAAALAWFFGASPPVALLVGGAMSMSSTAIVTQQLTDQAEINRTHGRLAFSILLYQDLIFVLFLALATSIAVPATYTAGMIAMAVGKAAVALAVVLVGGRLFARPLFFEIARAKGHDLFTLAVLFVTLTSAWVTHAVGLSMALGGFLAGMLLAETEYRHQVQAVIRPFRDILLGLFFVTIGTLLDIGLILRGFFLVTGMVVLLYVVKAGVVMLVARRYCDSWFKALRTALVIGAGGEFGFALLALLVKSHAQGAHAQLLLAVVTVSMVTAPFVIRHNKAIARFMLREKGPATTAMTREAAIDAAIARREHVILCGCGRVGQNIAQVIEELGFEYIAVELDPKTVRTLRAAGMPVVFGDSADEQVLESVGIATASVVVITFPNAAIALGIVRAVRRYRADVPILVRTQDDAPLRLLQEAGATEVVPEAFEASLMLVSHVLLFLDVPMRQVVRMVGKSRSDRYATLRAVFHESEELSDTSSEELHTVTLPPGAWSIGQSLQDVTNRGAAVRYAAVRREGIVGRDPDSSMVLREGDVVVIFGTPEALEHAEAVLLAG
jgi:monovalent cation:H+ antiporter-2, CPA2 family